MHIRFSALAQRLVFLGIIGALVAGAVEPVSADIPLPIVDIVPLSSFTTTEHSVDPAGGPKNPAPTNGDIALNGTATLPLFVHGLSASYDHVSLGALDSALAAVPLAGGATLYPGGSRDIVQNFRLDYAGIKRFNVETGFGYRHRSCCPANSAEWHKAFLSINYSTPPISALYGTVFVFGITGNDSTHYVTPAALAAAVPGLTVNKGQILTTQQFVTAVVPIDKKSGVRLAGTWVWGALDYFGNAPFPYYYNVFVVAATKQVSSTFGVSANITSVHQRLQGAPFPVPGGIETSALNVFADYHLDFASLLKKSEPPVQQGRPSQPGTPNGPAGPARPGASQGGTVSPGPEMSPGASPAPMMPGASPAPMMSGSPEPMMSASPAPMMSGAPASPTPAP